MPMAAPSVPGGDAPHTMAISAVPPPDWAQQGLRTTMSTLPMAASRAPGASTQMTMPMASAGTPPVAVSTVALTAASPAAPPPASPVAPTVAPPFVYVAGGGALAAGLLLAGIWLGRSSHDALRFERPAPAATAATAVTTPSPLEPTPAPPTSPPPAPTPAPSPAPTAPAPPARLAPPRTESADPRVKAARARLQTLKEQCPDSGCIPHYEWLLSQPAPPAAELSGAPRALDLCLARCADGG